MRANGHRAWCPAAAALLGFAALAATAVAAPRAGVGFDVVWKAAVDECFDGIGNPYPPVVDGQCAQGRPKRNDGYLFALTTTPDAVWYGTVANTACQVVGGALAAGGFSLMTPFQTDSLVCEFGQSQPAQHDPTVVAGAGDGRRPHVFEYRIATGEVVERTPADPIVDATGGFRAAGTVGNLVLFGGTVRGPEAAGISAGGITMLAFRADTGEFLGGRLFQEYGNIRDFITIDGVLYTGVGVRATGGGAVLRWIGDAASPFEFEVVGSLDTQPASFALHEGRLFATTWMNMRTYRTGGLYMSPVVSRIRGLRAADASGWTRVWGLEDYEPDFMNAISTTVGDVASFQGDLYWGSMQPPFMGALAHLQVMQSREPTDILAALVGADRRVSIYRGRNFGKPHQRLELLYGERYLPAFDPATQRWSLRPTGMGKPRFGRSGFGGFDNRYLWSLEVHEGALYFGTFDSSLLEHELLTAMPQLLAGLGMEIDLPESVLSTMLAVIAPALDNRMYTGADLWRMRMRTARALPVSLDGLRNTRNYGVRHLESRAGALWIGTANPFNLDPQGGPELIRMRTRPAR